MKVAARGHNVKNFNNLEILILNSDFVARLGRLALRQYCSGVLDAYDYIANFVLGHD